MKLFFVCLCVVAVTWAASTDHLFDGLVQSLGQYFRTKYNHQYIVTQDVCKTDCEVHLKLSVEMCTSIICVKCGYTDVYCGIQQSSGQLEWTIKGRLKVFDRSFHLSARL